MTTSVTGSRTGFTLIEILVVISLLIILVAALVANTLSVGQRAYRSATETLFQRLDLSAGTYKDRVGFYPADGMDGQLGVESKEGRVIRSSACLYEFLGRPLRVEKVAPGGRKVVERYPSPILRLRESELERIPGDKTVAEIADAWGVPIHYDRLEGEDSYSLQDSGEVHLNPTETHPSDPRELEGVYVLEAGKGQNRGRFDLWSHGQKGHDVEAGSDEEYEPQGTGVVCNWEKPRL
jgi:type II secretory pathway pseudopilin PulG